MNIKFQYNKTSRQALQKQLKVRERALPTLQSKEAELRFEVQQAKEKADILSRKLNKLIADYDNMVALWSEFRPDLFRYKM